MSSPVRVKESVEIARPAGEVWNAIADYSFDERWRKGLEDMTPDPPGPPQVGTKVHEVVRNSGREYVADTVVTSLRPGVSYEFSGHGSIGGLEGARTVQPSREGSGSVFTYEIELTPQGGMRVLRPVLGMFVRSGLRKELRTLRDLLEEGGPK